MDEDIGTAVAGIIILTLGIVIVLFLGIVIVVEVLFLRFLWKRRQGNGNDDTRAVTTSNKPSFPKLFHLPARESWASAYDFWLFQLEEITGGDFVSSPEKITAGVLTINMGSGFIMSALLLPILGLPIGAGILAAAFLLSLWVSSVMTQPVRGFFPISGGGNSTSKNNRRFGDEVEDYLSEINDDSDLDSFSIGEDDI